VGVGPSYLFFKSSLKSKWLAKKNFQKYVFFTNCIYAGNLGLIQACAKGRNFFLFLFFIYQD
jgi:hypothetical protein